MISDSFFKIGTGHTVCQDYALSSLPGDDPFAIVSDGCSGASLSDVGARLLCFSGRLLLNQPDDIPSHITTLALALGISPEHHQTFAATILMIRGGEKWSSYIFGDGVLVRARITGTEIHKLDIQSFESTTSYPPYPAYKADPETWARYIDGCGGACLERLVSDQEHSPVDVPFKMEWDPEEFNFAMVGTDGWRTFSEDPQFEVLRTIVRRVASTPATSGFLKRCVSATLRRCSPHFDDVGASALWSPR